MPPSKIIESKQFYPPDAPAPGFRPEDAGVKIDNYLYHIIGLDFKKNLAD
jgi:hypothetical protein